MNNGGRIIIFKINMKKCKTCLEMYGHDHPTAGLGEFKMFGDYCPYCGSFNSDFNKDSLIALVIAAIFFIIILVQIPASSTIAESNNIGFNFIKQLVFYLFIEFFVYRLIHFKYKF